MTEANPAVTKLTDMLKQPGRETSGGDLTRRVRAAVSRREFFTSARGGLGLAALVSLL